MLKNISSIVAVIQFAGANYAVAAAQLPDIYLRYTVNSRALEKVCGPSAAYSNVQTSTVEEFFSGIKHAKFTRGIQFSWGVENPCDIRVEGPYVDSEIDDGEFRYVWRNNKPATKTISPVKRQAAVKAHAGRYNNANPGMAKALSELKDWPAMAAGLGAHIRAEETGETVLRQPCKTIHALNTKMCQWATIPVYGPLKHPVTLSFESPDKSAIATDFVVSKLPQDVFKVPDGVVIKNGQAR